MWGVNHHYGGILGDNSTPENHPINSYESYFGGKRKEFLN